MCVWKVGLNEFSAPWVGVSGRFMRCLDAEEAERERWSFHSGEVRGEGDVDALWFVVVRVRCGRRIVVDKRLLVMYAVGLVVRRRWSCESSTDSGVEEMSVTYRFIWAFLWWVLDCSSRCLLCVVSHSSVVSVFIAEEVLLARRVFSGFRRVPLWEVGEVCRFDVEGFVVL